MKNVFRVCVLFLLAGAVFGCKNSSSRMKLTDYQWLLKTMYINGESLVITANNPSVVFTDSSRINGYGGCNRFFGNYEENGSKLSIQVLGVTQAMCPDIEIEDRFLAILRNVTTYEIAEEQLVLYDGGNQQLAIVAPDKTKNRDRR